MRSCRVSQFKFFRDSDLTTTVTWYFVDGARGAPNFGYLPLAHRFSPGDLDAYNGAWLDELGEQRLPDPEYYKGRRLGVAPGLGYCGTPDQWLNGCRIADALGPSQLGPDGVTPACCFGGAGGNGFVHTGGGFCKGFCKGFCIGR